MPTNAYRHKAIRQVEALARKQYGLVTRSQARSLGMTDDEIDYLLLTGAWIRVFPGVLRMSGSPTTTEGRWMAACLRKPGRVWLAYRSAGRFWRLDGCDVDITEVLTTADLRGSRGGVIIHRTKAVPARDLTVVRNLPVTTVHRTLADLGAVCDLDVVELAVESALRRHITSVARLERQLAACSGRGRRGPKTLRIVLRQRGHRPPTDSHLETRFLQFLRRHGFPEPDRQERIYGDDGLIARVDFFYEEFNLIIEVDSRAHHTRQLDWERDLRRRNALTSHGRRVLHVTDHRLRRDPIGIAAELRRAFGLGAF